MRSASSIYVPVLVNAGEFDTDSYPTDCKGLMRDLSNPPTKRSVPMKNATHFLLFEKPRFELFEAVGTFLKEGEEQGHSVSKLPVRPCSGPLNAT